MSIEVKDLCYSYDVGTAFEKSALKNVNFTLNKGEFVGVIGHTGSGKSTMIQHLNALLKPTSGQVLYDGKDIFDPEAKEFRKTIRQKVGLVFQYPEHQLFEMSIYKDVAFGPTNMKLPPEEIKERVEWALRLVGMDASFYEKSPFDLSGGQKRRVSVAGVLAMKPEYLILDEPAAGLDPKGRDELFEQIAKLREETGMTILLVSHSMEDVAKYVDRLLVFNQGELVYDDTPAQVFQHRQELEGMGLSVPQIVKLKDLLKEEGINIAPEVIRMEEMEEALVQIFGSNGQKSLGQKNDPAKKDVQNGKAGKKA